MTTTTPAQTVRSLCTPEQHAQASKVKPVKVVDLGNGPHGNYVLVEFPDGWQRPIDLPTVFDAWHPIFEGLSTEDKNRMTRHIQAPIVKHPDGRRTQQGALSFITKDVNRLGYWVSENSFDVPVQTYCDGQITGYECAGEFFAALKRGYGPYLHKGKIIEAALQAFKDPFDEPGQRGAAVAFMEVVYQAIGFMAKHGNHEAFIAGRIEQTKLDRDSWAKEDTDRRAEFVERMKAGKALKKKAVKLAQPPQIGGAS